MKNLTCPQCGTEVRDFTRENVEFEIRVVNRMIANFEEKAKNSFCNSDWDEVGGYERLIRYCKYTLDHLENILK